MLKERLITAVVAVLLLGIALFVLPEQATRVVIAVVMLVAAWEWGGFLAGGTRHRLLCVGLIALLQVGLYYLLAGRPEAVFLIFQAALVWWAAALLWLFAYPTPVPRALTWIAAILVLLPAWLAIDFVFRVSPNLLLFMLIIVWAADIGAYFAGKRFGRVKLAPRVSPGKTWEGVLGGMLLVVAVAFAGSAVLDAAPLLLVPFVLSVAALSIVGDLTVSVFKRNADIKDSGKLFPGHGGLLDRIDSVMAAAPLFALGIRWTGMS